MAGISAASYFPPTLSPQEEPFVTEWSRTDQITVETIGGNFKLIHRKKTDLEKLKYLPLEDFIREMCESEETREYTIDYPPRTFTITKGMSLPDFTKEVFSSIHVKGYDQDPLKNENSWRLFVENEGYLVDDQGHHPEDCEIILTKTSKVYLIHKNMLYSLSNELKVQTTLLHPFYNHNLDLGYESLYEYNYLKWCRMVPVLSNLMKEFLTWDLNKRGTFIKELCKSRLSLQFPIADLERIESPREFIEPSFNPRDPLNTLSKIDWKIHNIICSYLNYGHSFDFQETVCPIFTRQAILESRSLTPWALLKETMESRAPESAEARVVCYFGRLYFAIQPYIEKIQIARDFEDWKEFAFLMNHFKKIVQDIASRNTFDSLILRQKLEESNLEDTHNWKKDCELLCPSNMPLFEALDQIIRTSTPLINLHVKHTHRDIKTFELIPGTTRRKFHMLVESWLKEIGEKNLNFRLGIRGRMILTNARSLRPLDTGAVFNLIPSGEVGSWRNFITPQDDSIIVEDPQRRV